MLITVFTPTYNRAYILGQAYNSLHIQSCKDFEWIIVDDGSTDNTKELVNQWIKEADFPIKYIYQHNQGRYAAFNNSVEMFSGELMLPLDSDDYLKPNCIQRIVEIWSERIDKDSLSGILCYIESGDGSIIGNEFPQGLEKERHYILRDKYNLVGDKIEICRCDLLKQERYPVFKNEKFTGDQIIYYHINKKFPEVLVREIIYHREYLADGLTNNVRKHHLSSINGMIEHYKNLLEFEKYNKTKILKHTIGYIAFSLMDNRSFQGIVNSSPRKLISVVLFPFGVMLKIYLQNFEKRTNN